MILQQARLDFTIIRGAMWADADQAKALTDKLSAPGEDPARDAFLEDVARIPNDG